MLDEDVQTFPDLIVYTLMLAGSNYELGLIGTVESLEIPEHLAHLRDYDLYGSCESFMAIAKAEIMVARGQFRSQRRDLRRLVGGDRMAGHRALSDLYHRVMGMAECIARREMNVTRV